jgi:hypothetical protein
MDPADPIPTIEHSKTDQGVSFSYKGKPVASYGLSEETLSRDEAVALGRFLLDKTQLHPTIIAALVLEGRVPKRLSFSLPPMRRKSPEIWSLQSVTGLSVPYPLTKNYEVGNVIDGNGGPAAASLAEIMPLLLSAVAGHAGNGPRSIVQYQALIDTALQQKTALQAVLWMLEASEQYGPKAFDCSETAPGPCHSMKDIYSETKDDARVADLFKSFSVERADPNQAINLRRKLRRDDVANGYVIEGFIGNTLHETGHDGEALPLLMDELRGDPYVAGYYKDLGDLFRESFEPALAWTCYDLGRSLPGGKSAPVIDQVNAYEAQLSVTYPYFF